MNKISRILLVVIIAAIGMLSAGEIRFNGVQKDFQLFSNGSKKIMNYILLNPGEKLMFQTIDVDSLTIYSRIIDDKVTEYSYLVNYNGQSKIVERTAKVSKVTKTLSGEVVSAYNSFKKQLSRNEQIQITNTWNKVILFKLTADKNEKNYESYDYVRFSPQYYENEVILNISDKSYTYFQVDSTSIAFDLEGPVLVKIVSRLIYNDNFQNHKGYHYNVFDNGELMSSFEEKASRSEKAFFPDHPDKTPSTGDVNIIQLGEGHHHVVVRDGILNRDLIFRFYINKSSIGIID